MLCSYSYFILTVSVDSCKWELQYDCYLQAEVPHWDCSGSYGHPGVFLHTIYCQLFRDKNRTVWVQGNLEWTVRLIGVTVQTFDSWTSRPDVCQCLVVHVQTPMDNMSSNKPSTSKLSVVRSPIHMFPW